MFEVEQNAKHENPLVRATAAASPHATRSMLDRLADDPVPQVREWVARNTNVHKDTLWRLADDESARVRAFVAWNPKAPLLMVKYLSEDVDEVVRMMAQNVLDNRD